MYKLIQIRDLAAGQVTRFSNVLWADMRYSGLLVLIKLDTSSLFMKGLKRIFNKSM